MEKYRKAIVAVATTALVAIIQFIPLSDLVHGWIEVAVATLGAFGVYRIPNEPMPESPKAPSDGS